MSEKVLTEIDFSFSLSDISEAIYNRIGKMPIRAKKTRSSITVVFDSDLTTTQLNLVRQAIADIVPFYRFNRSVTKKDGKTIKTIKE